MRESLAYRRHAREIRQGRVPEKYTRVADLVTGKRVLEIGSAEGVLSLLLAQTADWVTGVELRPDRHNIAMELRESWRRRGKRVGNCTLICADIRERMDLLRDIDTVVAVRSIYYLREDVETVFYAVAQCASEVVLCGNPSRWPRYENEPERLGKFNWFASGEGMRALLESIGYEIVHEVKEGDPIVVGRRDRGAASSDHGEDHS